MNHVTLVITLWTLDKKNTFFVTVERWGFIKGDAGV